MTNPRFPNIDTFSRIQIEEYDRGYSEDDYREKEGLDSQIEPYWDEDDNFTF